jgi:hypothetical protein
MFDISIESIGIIVSSITAISVVALGFFQYRLARQLYKLEKDKVKLELYRKRYDIYIKVQEFIAIIQNRHCKTEDSINFLKNTRENIFLFRQDIIDYRDELYKKSIDMRLFDDPKGKEKDPSRFQEIQDWLISNPFEESTKKFKPYLDFTQL